jgi:hypothetical protein
VFNLSARHHPATEEHCQPRLKWAKDTEKDKKTDIPNRRSVVYCKAATFLDVDVYPCISSAQQPPTLTDGEVV